MGTALNLSEKDVAHSAFLLPVLGSVSGIVICLARRDYVVPTAASLLTGYATITIVAQTDLAKNTIADQIANSSIIARIDPRLAVVIIGFAWLAASLTSSSSRKAFVTSISGVCLAGGIVVWLVMYMPHMLNGRGTDFVSANGLNLSGSLSFPALLVSGLIGFLVGNKAYIAAILAAIGFALGTSVFIQFAEMQDLRFTVLHSSYWIRAIGGGCIALSGFLAFAWMTNRLRTAVLLFIVMCCLGGTVGYMYGPGLTNGRDLGDWFASGPVIGAVVAVSALSLALGYWEGAVAHRRIKTRNGSDEVAGDSSGHSVVRPMGKAFDRSQDEADVAAPRHKDRPQISERMKFWFVENINNDLRYASHDSDFVNWTMAPLATAEFFDLKDAEQIVEHISNRGVSGCRVEEGGYLRAADETGSTELNENLELLAEAFSQSDRKMSDREVASKVAPFYNSGIPGIRREAKLLYLRYGNWQDGQNEFRR
ncbi:MAG: hypothetical protein ABGX07_16110 [Pirellulaceae bacterium]|nr:hypothetical protein [Planctomycetaceae bacterium]HIM29772.1 hypothetical protein [Planctomycetota bacterium]